MERYELNLKNDAIVSHGLKDSTRILPWLDRFGLQIAGIITN
jgi:hypothetical protein